MFERYTERARQVVVLAQDEARQFKHNYIGTEHILLGLLREEESLGARVLRELDLTVEDVRGKIREYVGEGEDPAPVGQIPFTPKTKKALEMGLREALALGHNYIGTEHVLLGLVRLGEGTAATIFADFELTAEKIRNRVIEILSGPARRRQLDAQLADTIDLALRAMTICGDLAEMRAEVLIDQRTLESLAVQVITLADLEEIARDTHGVREALKQLRDDLKRGKAA